MTWKTKLKITGPSGSSLHFDGELTTEQKDAVIAALEYCHEPAGKSSAEPFGYFKAEAFGWTDCAETDEGARPLFELATVQAVEAERDEWIACHAKIYKQRDELLAALQWLLNRAAPEWEAESGIIEYAEACKHARSLIASVKGGAA